MEVVFNISYLPSQQLGVNVRCGSLHDLLEKNIEAKINSAVPTNLEV